jgi:hypothetical protein
MRTLVIATLQALLETRRIIMAVAIAQYEVARERLERARRDQPGESTALRAVTTANRGGRQGNLLIDPPGTAVVSAESLATIERYVHRRDSSASGTRALQEAWLRLVPPVNDFAVNLRIDSSVTTEMLRDRETNCCEKVCGKLSEEERDRLNTLIHPSPASELSAFNRIRALVSCRAGCFPAWRSQAAVFGRTVLTASRAKLSAPDGDQGENPSKAGAARRMARSDHCGCVSTPRWARTF